ncbi:antitoxin VbhA family protein [Arthrobacter woluwensis]|uniref:Antitoxin VbhA domain-containing protein n=1 Tax=Arthrobacter woluwensis TaxID=156980 RepID=A0A1H4I712_9MICC|nr:antitoxin VbhA family protein [Arthrobacter woluwensis]SEB29695.1 hypothetical protein SAMN04489745_0073 [Arthrobacter woluwensis]
MARTLATTKEQVEERMAFADAGLALAGHALTDPRLRELSRRVAAHEITAEEAIRQGRELIQHP